MRIHWIALASAFIGASSLAAIAQTPADPDGIICRSYLSTVRGQAGAMTPERVRALRDAVPAHCVGTLAELETLASSARALSVTDPASPTCERLQREWRRMTRSVTLDGARAFRSAVDPACVGTLGVVNARIAELATQ